MAITRLHERLRCHAQIAAKSSAGEAGELELAVEVRNDAGELKLAARAVVFLD
jgi:hypothetical protein